MIPEHILEMMVMNYSYVLCYTSNMLTSNMFPECSFKLFYSDWLLRFSEYLLMYFVYYILYSENTSLMYYYQNNNAC